MSGAGDTRATTGPGQSASAHVGGVLERSDELGVLETARAEVADGRRGRLVLIAGEAGIGKTALVGAFCAGLAGTRILRGGCDPLLTARPLGPLADIAEQTGGELAQLIDDGAAGTALLGAFARELRRAPSVVVLEDLHWADEATLDFLLLFGRRIESVPALTLATFRDDELDRSHPLRIVIGELPRATSRRVSLGPLSAEAVAQLARGAELDPGRLHRQTAGNPFFVTEALAAGGDSLPDTVRDAVLARAARLEPAARQLLDAVAIVPSHAELWLLEALVGGDLVHLERCLASGMLHVTDGAVAFRHEIARAAVQDVLPPDRALRLHRAAVAALADPPRGRPDLARLAHHAEAAGDADAVLSYAPDAAERAALLGAHREAAAQFAGALRFADRLSAERRAWLFERRGYECYLTGAIDQAIAARTASLAEYRTLDDRLRQGDTHRWLSRLAWFAGDNAEAEAQARRAVELLGELPPGPELAMAQSNMAQLRMLAYDHDGALEWGTRAIELAERLGETEILVHALNNVGMARLESGRDSGEEVERSLTLATEAGLEEHVARAHTNLGAVSVQMRDYPRATRHLGEGIAYCAERDLDSWGLYMTGWRARVHLEQGRWDEAAAEATAVLRRPGTAIPSRITPLAVLGRLRARRGDPDVWGPLDEAVELAAGTGEVQRLLPVALARAEARWLGGEPGAVADETDGVLELAMARASVWELGELLMWRRRGELADVPPAREPAPPWCLELAGEGAAAARAWAELGCPYEAALAALAADDDALLRHGHAELLRLGAPTSAAHVARVMRERGVRDLRQGPRASTRENPAGLTARELDVVALLAEGLRNAQIAERLVVSRKTVDHHVSSILGKLGVSTRTEAAAEAARLGIVASG
ncbi:MAG TPA: AAA family ATPase [Solirubrobacteraceae bacterium]|nr:AAA family ATPase [Solirubrobacteraceae bacterium]